MKQFILKFKCGKAWILSALPLIALLTLFSCVRETQLYPEVNGDEALVTLSLKVPAASRTRSLTTAQEDAVKNVQVLAFKADDDTFAYSTTSSTTSDGRTFTVTLRKGTWNLVVLANASDLISGISEGDAQSTVLNNLAKSITAGMGWSTSVAQSNGLPMCSEVLSDKEIDDDTQPITGIELYRTVAKVDVAVAADNFTLESVRVYNYETTGKVYPIINGGIPEFALPTTGTNKIKGYSSGQLIYTKATYPDNDGIGIADTYCTNVIYLNPSEAGSKDDLGTNTCLVIGGSYDGGETSYYRVDFSLSDGTYVDLIRNHKYLINITKVGGSGYDNENTAFDSGPMNMVVEVVEWNEGDMDDIYFDGQSYFGIDKKSIVFSPMGDETVVYNVITNIPDWSMWLGISKKLDAQSAALYTNTECGFTYSVTKTGQDKYQLTVTSNKHNIYAGGNERKEEFTIKALRLNIPFTVEQLSGSTYVSVINGDIARLYPEGTESGTVLPIDIMATKPVTVTISGDGDGSWATLTGDQSGLSVASGSGIFSAKLTVNVDVFNPTTFTSFTGQLRTAQITITPQGDPSITYTITQEMPYIALSTGIVSISRTSTEFSKTVDVLTNIQSSDLSLITTTQDIYNRITTDVLTAGDQLRPRFRRYTVTADMSGTLPIEAFSSVFAVAANAKYGIVSPSTTFIVYSGNDLWQWIWSWPGTGVTTNTYIFPWNTATATDAISFTSSAGLEWDSGKEGAANPASITVSSPSGEDYPVSITFDNKYNEFGSYNVWFKNTDNSKTQEITFHKGVQVMDYSASVFSLDYKAADASSPITLGTVTSNVAWKATMSGGSGWAQLRAGTDTWIGDGTTATVDNTTTDAAVYTGSNPGCVTAQTPLQLSIEDYNTLNADPVSRSATIGFTNESYDVSKLGAAAPVPITVTQYAPVLTFTSSTLPTDFSIPETGGNYTITGMANIAGCFVKVYVGSSTTATYSFALNAEEGYVFPAGGAGVAGAIKATFTIPSVTATRTLQFRLYHPCMGTGTTYASEIEIGTWTQIYTVPSYPAYEGVIGYDPATGQLNLNGVGVMVYFKYGGIIGMYSGGNNSPNNAWNGVYSIAFNPTTISTFTNYQQSFPIGAGDQTTIGDINVFHTLAGGKNGNGDPCRFIKADGTGMTADEVKAALADGSIPDLGIWRLPTNDDNAKVKFSPANMVWETQASPSDPTIQRNGHTFSGLNKGANFAETTWNFLPAAGSRSSDGTVQNQGSYGYYWSSNISETMNNFGAYLPFGINVVATGTGDPHIGMPVRCVRAGD